MSGITIEITEDCIGAYDMRVEATRVHAAGDSKYTLAVDCFCGQGELEGGTYRRHYGRLSAGQVASLLRRRRVSNDPEAAVWDWVRSTEDVIEGNDGRFLRRGRVAAWDM